MSQAGIINVSSQSGIVDSVTGTLPIVVSPNTGNVVVSLPGLTAHNVLIGEGTAAIGLASPVMAGFVLTDNGPGVDPSFQAISFSGAITTITGNSGGAESPLAGNFNILGTGSITTVGSANTETIQLTGLTNHNVLVGSGTATIGLIVPSTSGFVLTSNGASADPTFQGLPASGIMFTGDSGTPFTTSSVTIFANNVANACGSTVLFNASTPDITLQVTDTNNNTFVGLDSGAGGSIGSIFCTAFGSNSMMGAVSNSFSTAIGYSALSADVSGQFNFAGGSNCLAGLNGGNYNTAIGSNAGYGASPLTNGNHNLLIGYNAGENYSFNESYNILLMSSGQGGESFTTRIGFDSGAPSQQACFLDGITNVSASSLSSPAPVFVDLITGQLAFGTASINWVGENGDFSANPGFGYFVGATSTATLPLTPAQGSTIEFVNTAVGVLTIQAQGSDKIQFGNNTSSIGGSIVSAVIGDAVTLVYDANNATWETATGSMGNWYLDSGLVINSTGAFGTSLYQVSSTLSLGQYSLIQDAINAAVADGASITNQKFVMLASEQFNENLTFYDGVNIVSVSPNSGRNNGFPSITGTHTLSGSPTVTFENITFLNTAFENVFTIANTCTLSFSSCYMSDNNTGNPTLFDISSGSANANIIFSNGTNCAFQSNLLSQSNGYCGLSLYSTSTVGIITLDSTVNTVQFNFNIYNSIYSSTIRISGDNCFFNLVAFNSSMQCDIDGTSSNSTQTLTFYNSNLFTSTNGWKWKLATLFASNSFLDSYNSTTFINDTSGTGGSTYTFEGCTFTCPSIGSFKGSTTVIHSGSLAGSGAPTLSSGATINYVGCVGFSGNSVLANTIANATNATDGFLYLPSCAGVPTGVPTVYNAGVPIIIDTTDNLPYFYNSAWYPISGLVTFSGDTGSFTNNAVTIRSNQSVNNSGASVYFDASTPNVTLNVTDANQSTFIGNLCGTTLGSFSNTAVGFQCMPVANTSSHSCAFGVGSLLLDTSGMNNCAFGENSLNTIDGGSNNSVFGWNAGQGLITTDSNNICIGANAIGNPGVSNSTIIGDGTQTTCYIGGINGVDSSVFTSPLAIFVDSSTGQLGYGNSIGVLGCDDFGTVTGAQVNILAYAATNVCGSSVRFTSSMGNTLTLNVTDGNQNTIIGLTAGNLGISGVNNTGIGNLALLSLTTGSGNLAGGSGALALLRDGSANVAVGPSALSSSVSDNSNMAIGGEVFLSLNGGSSNIGIGYGIAELLLTGANNILIGNQCANNYIGSESGNIIIGSGTPGNTGENNITSIGFYNGSPSQLGCYIDGIAGKSFAAGSPTPQSVIIDTSTGQLISSPLPFATPWSDQSLGVSVMPGYGYFLDAALIATLPTAPALGSTISFITTTASSVVIQAGTGDKIQIGPSQSSATGTATSTSAGNTLTLVYNLPLNTWYANAEVAVTWSLA